MRTYLAYISILHVRAYSDHVWLLMFLKPSESCFEAIQGVSGHPTISILTTIEYRHSQNNESPPPPPHTHPPCFISIVK